MKSYRYLKELPIIVTIPVLPVVSFALGAAVLVWVIWPIMSFKLLYSQHLSYVITPLAEDFINQAQANEAKRKDYSKASNWFPKAPLDSPATQVNTYTISIPKLGITNALVQIGTDDLSQSIIHYAGTGIPGKYGNTVLFGHSVLPQFFDPEKYLSIFSLIPELEEGDDIFVRFDGVDYRYEVVGARVTDPEDISGLEQRYDNSYLTLVTCFPPGTYFERYWLLARQKPFGKDLP